MSFESCTAHYMICPAMLTNVQSMHDTCEIIWQPLRLQQKTIIDCAAADKPAPCVQHSRPGFALQNETPIRVPPTLDIAAHCSKEALPSKPTYKLVAVANHMGSQGSGHCTADCRSAVDGQWYSCNDSTVQGSHYQQEPSELPYLLFYRHVE